MASKAVTITVYDNGDFGYDRALLGVSGGDVITWQAGPNTGDFTIKFLTPDSPLSTGEFTLGGSAAAPIARTVQNGLQVDAVYHYSVQAKHLPDGKQWSDPNCPELIIR